MQRQADMLCLVPIIKDRPILKLWPSRNRNALFTLLGKFHVYPSKLSKLCTNTFSTQWNFGRSPFHQKGKTKKRNTFSKGSPILNNNCNTSKNRIRTNPKMLKLRTEIKTERCKRTEKLFILTISGITICLSWFVTSMSQRFIINLYKAFK